MKSKRLITDKGLMSLADMPIEELSAFGIKRSELINEHDSCWLDPGGMAYIKAPIEKFAMSDCSFEIYADKAAGMADIIRRYGQSVDDYIMFPGHFCRYAMKTSTSLSLLTKLDEIAQSDNALHAQLDIEDALSKCPFIVRPGVPRG